MAWLPTVWYALDAILVPVTAEFNVIEPTDAEFGFLLLVDEYHPRGDCFMVLALTRVRSACWLFAWLCWVLAAALT